MNNDDCNNATNQPVSLNNKYNPYTAVFDIASPAPTYGAIATAAVDATVAAAASTIVPDAHIPPSGKKQYTKLFSPVNMNKMANKDTIYTIPALEAPTPLLLTLLPDPLDLKSPTPHIH